jgi:hypothetical protein
VELFGTLLPRTSTCERHPPPAQPHYHSTTSHQVSSRRLFPLPSKYHTKPWRTTSTVLDQLPVASCQFQPHFPPSLLNPTHIFTQKPAASLTPPFPAYSTAVLPSDLSFTHPDCEPRPPLSLTYIASPSEQRVGYVLSLAALVWVLPPPLYAKSAMYVDSFLLLLRKFYPSRGLSCRRAEEGGR